MRRSGFLFARLTPRPRIMCSYTSVSKLANARLLPHNTNMDAPQIIIGAGIIVCACVLAVWAGSAWRSRRHCAVMRNKIAEWTDGRTISNPIDGIDWYLRGCRAVRDGQMREAARYFGMAHHADWHIQTAALLTFSTLKASEGPESDLIDHMVKTWHEIREPEILKEREDRLLIESLTAKDPAPGRASSLGRLAWVIGGSAHRRRLESLLTEGPDWAAPLINEGSAR